MDKVKVRVVSRTGVVWEGEGSSCSLINSSGPFDILSEHTQFITQIQDSITVRDGDKDIWRYPLDSSALCRVKSNLVEIWLGI